MAAAGLCCSGETSGGPPDFSAMQETSQRKKAFFCYLAPMVEKENVRLLAERSRLQKILKEQSKGHSPSSSEEDFVKSLSIEFGLPDTPLTKSVVENLLLHADVIPVSLALAQAANESAWGTSRFAREANNYFGQWCFKPGCGLVPKERPKGQTYEVRSFSSTQDSVDAFMLNLNRNKPYAHFRSIRAAEQKRGRPLSGRSLAEGLKSYSARGEEYIHTLRAMIRSNKLEEFNTSSGIKQACEPSETHALRLEENQSRVGPGMGRDLLGA